MESELKHAWLNCSMCRVNKNEKDSLTLVINAFNDDVCSTGVDDVSVCGGAQVIFESVLRARHPA